MVVHGPPTGFRVGDLWGLDRLRGFDPLPPYDVRNPTMGLAGVDPTAEGLNFVEQTVLAPVGLL